MRALKWFVVVVLSFFLFLFLLPFGALFTVNQTALNPGFVNAHIETLDLASVAQDMFRDKVKQDLPDDMSGISPGFTDQLIENVIPALEPWAKAQAKRLVTTGYDYILGNSDHFAMDIPLDQVKVALKDEAWALFQASPPREAAGFSPTQLRQLFDQKYSQFTKDMPASIKLDETTLNDMDAGVLHGLNQARKIVSYFRTGYFACIGLTVLFVAGIAFITWRVRLGTRVVGAVLLAAGIIGLAVVLVITNVVLPGIKLPDIADGAFTVWMNDLITDLFSPWKWLSIGLVIGGVALLVVSFVYKPRARRPAAEPLPPLPPAPVA